MGNTIRFVFKTNFKYSLFDRICILICLFGIGLWIYVFITLFLFK